MISDLNLLGTVDGRSPSTFDDVLAHKLIDKSQMIKTVLRRKFDPGRAKSVKRLLNELHNLIEDIEDIL